MSFTAAHESKLARRACQLCRERKARFRHRGEVRADRDHVLCFECYRSERDRRRAQLLADVGSPSWLESSLGYSKGTLTEAQLAHRRRMFQHLRSLSFLQARTRTRRGPSGIA